MPSTTTAAAAATTSLAAQLAARETDLLAQLGPEVAAAIRTTSASLAARYTPAPLPLASAAPHFELPSATGSTVALSRLLENHTAVVLTWYRGAWCPYCNLALRAMQQANAEIEALGAKLVCLTPESPDESLALAEKMALPFHVLSDDGLLVADKFGVAFEVGEDTKALYAGMGVHLDDINGNGGARKAKLPLPATFVLDKEGTVIYSFADLEYTRRAEPADIIRAIKSLTA